MSTTNDPIAEEPEASLSSAPQAAVWQLANHRFRSLPCMRWLEYTVFLGLVVGLARPVGLYLVRVFERKRTILDPLLCPVETILYRLLRVRPEVEMSAAIYLACLLLFSAVGTSLLFLVLMGQTWLPGGPDDSFLTTPRTVDLAANTAVSFSTTTTWQAYGGESTLRLALVRPGWPLARTLKPSRWKA